MNTFTAVVLIVVVVSGDGKQAVHQERMPDMDTCIMELGKFLRHQFPDLVGARKLKAGCDGDLALENPS